MFNCQGLYMSDGFVNMEKQRMVELMQSFGKHRHRLRGGEATSDDGHDGPTPPTTPQADDSSAAAAPAASVAAGNPNYASCSDQNSIDYGIDIDATDVSS